MHAALTISIALVGGSAVAQPALIGAVTSELGDQQAKTADIRRGPAIASEKIAAGWSKALRRPHRRLPTY